MEVRARGFFPTLDRKYNYSIYYSIYYLHPRAVNCYLQHLTQWHIRLVRPILPNMKLDHITRRCWWNVHKRRSCCPPFQTRLCNKRLSTLLHLSSLQRTISSLAMCSDRKFPCNSCSSVFKKSTGLKRHAKLHIPKDSAEVSAQYVS